MTRALVAAAVAAALGAVGFGVLSPTEASPASPSLSVPTRVASRPAVRFRYEPVTATTFDAVRPLDTVIVGPQPTVDGDRRAVAAVHARGGRAFRYVQFYWAPTDRTYQTVAIRRHPDWAFCDASGALTDTHVHTGAPWVYLDLNERAARNTYVRFLRAMHAIGYDGVFVDMGGHAILGPTSTAISACTANPVVPGRTFGAAYIAMLGQARDVGLQVFLNGGILTALDRVPAVWNIGLAGVLDERAAWRGPRALAADRAVATARVVPVAVLVRPNRHATDQVAAVAAAGLAPVYGVRAADEAALTLVRT